MTIYESSHSRESMVLDQRHSDALIHWSAYHVGTKRRLDIMLDILWAQAVRLKDLPLCDVAMAAEVKRVLRTGQRNRRRAAAEAWRLRSPYTAIALRRLLRSAEYRSIMNPAGVPMTEAREEIRGVTRL